MKLIYIFKILSLKFNLQKDQILKDHQLKLNLIKWANCVYIVNTYKKLLWRQSPPCQGLGTPLFLISN